MANTYKFTGVTLTTTDTTAILTAGTAETIILKSIIVSSAAYTPTVTFSVTDDSASATYLIAHYVTLTANNSEQILTKPQVLEGGDILKFVSSSSDSLDIVMSYLVLTRT